MLPSGREDVRCPSVTSPVHPRVGAPYRRQRPTEVRQGRGRDSESAEWILPWTKGTERPTEGLRQTTQGTLTLVTDDVPRESDSLFHRAGPSAGAGVRGFGAYLSDSAERRGCTGHTTSGDPPPSATGGEARVHRTHDIRRPATLWDRWRGPPEEESLRTPGLLSPNHVPGPESWTAGISVPDPVDG